MEKIMARGTGRRKTGVARVIIREGTGDITINKKKAEEYFADENHLRVLKAPLVLTSSENIKIDINVSGGGLSGQAEACRHGIARALLIIDSANRKTLKANGMLTRDARMVERKKYGRRGARRKFQFSKR